MSQVLYVETMMVVVVTLMTVMTMMMLVPALILPHSLIVPIKTVIELIAHSQWPLHLRCSICHLTICFQALLTYNNHA